MSEYIIYSETFYIYEMTKNTRYVFGVDGFDVGQKQDSTTIYGAVTFKVLKVGVLMLVAQRRGGGGGVGGFISCCTLGI